MAEPHRRSQPLTKERMGIRPGLPLEVAGTSPDDLRRAVQLLMDIEAIQQLKHAYFRCIDTANFDELEGLFHEDVTVHFIGGFYEWKLEGRAAYLESIRQSFHRRAVGHHNGHHPEIQILSDREATGIWYLADNMWILEHQFFTTGTAVYWDRYLKVDGRWTIKDTRYERIYEQNRKLDENPAFSAHYLATFGASKE
jgi:hypothetical protein